MSAAPMWEPQDPEPNAELHVGLRMFKRYLNQPNVVIEAIPGGGSVLVLHGHDIYLDPCPSTKDHHGERVLCDEKRGHDVDGLHANFAAGVMWGDS